MNYPRTLHAGGCIGIAAPAFPMAKERLDQCVKRLEDMGYQVKTGHNLAAGSNFHGYLCGSGKDRAEELNSLFADPEVDAIICIRGGYGSAQVMKYLDYELIRNHPKVFVGYSDITNPVSYTHLPSLPRFFLHIPMTRRILHIFWNGPAKPTGLERTN